MNTVTLKELQKALFESVNGSENVKNQIEQSISQFEKHITKTCKGVRFELRTTNDFSKRYHEKYIFPNYDFSIIISERHNKPDTDIIEKIEKFVKDLEKFNIAKVEFSHMDLSDDDSATYIYDICIWIIEPENGFISATKDRDGV